MESSAPAVKPTRSTLIKVLDLLFLLGAVLILALFTTVYLMPFRLDDVLHIEWAQTHTFWDAWHPIRGEIVRSVRPVFAATIWLLTNYVGLYNYTPWHVTLVGSYLIALAFSGLTARYIARRPSALYFTTALYWVAFAPIVNVLFWYGDLTFTLELMFLTPAWYYGLRGLLEGRLGLFAIGSLLGAFAVMAKEPAIPLLHGVWLGAILVRWREFKAIWLAMPKTKRWLFIGLYAAVVGTSLWILVASPTKSNRFFSLDMPWDQLQPFVEHRIDYYSAVLLSPIARLLLITPIVYMAVEIASKRFGDGLGQFVTRLVISGVFASLFFYPVWLALILLIGMLIWIGVRHPTERRAAWLSLPFVLCVALIASVLLITVALVKTQLNELALTILVVTGWAWSRVLETGWNAAAPYLASPRSKMIAGIVSFIVIYGALVAMAPKIATYEQLLRDVRDVRANANDALKWAAKHLPRNVVLAVTGNRLHGIGSADDLTSKDDHTKLQQQYTFLQGYNHVYLKTLGRRDILVSYLEDSLVAMRALDSMRSNGDAYLFLQTGLDHQLFHGSDIPNLFLKSRDTLIAKFDQGPYPAEIWELRRSN